MTFSFGNVNMAKLRPLLDKLDWLTAILLCATLGLAPFVPEPHIWEKLKMIVAADPVAWIDAFDVVFHGLPWMLLILKAISTISPRDPS